MASLQDNRLTNSRLQNVLNEAARLLYGAPRYSPITLSFGTSYTLICRERAQFKLRVTIYKALRNVAQEYLKELLCIMSTNERRSILRSADRQNLVRTRTAAKFGEKAFCVTGPVAWNLLPVDIRQVPTLVIFKRKLKIFLSHGRILIYDVGLQHPAKECLLYGSI